MLRYLLFISMLASETFAGGEELAVIAWNVESGGNRRSTIGAQLAGYEGFHLWGLSEVHIRNVDFFVSKVAEGEPHEFRGIAGTTGGADRLVIAYDAELLVLLDTHELIDLAMGGGRAPLVAQFATGGGDEFLFAVNHFHRRNAEKRRLQAEGFRRWAMLQSLPIVALGDYNFDYDIASEQGNRAFQIMMEGAIWNWVKPESLVATNFSDRDGDGQNDFNSVLDFVFVAGDAVTWQSTSSIVVQPGDFPDDHRTSDHRPVTASLNTEVHTPLANRSTTTSGRARIADARSSRLVITSKRASAGETRSATSSSTRDPLSAAGAEIDKPGMGATGESSEDDDAIADAQETREMRFCHRGLPPLYEERLLKRDSALIRATTTLGPARVRSVLSRFKTWPPEHTITVAFRGGDTGLHRRIADAASLWVEGTGLKLDFGYDEASDSFRHWTPSDGRYAADVRIGFSYPRDPNYWSLVGTDSRDPNVVHPGEPSMNLEGFDFDYPADGNATVLHEFGHALGFEHEHQNPADPCDFRFDDDTNYELTLNGSGHAIPDSAGRRPGLFTSLAHEPNNWSEEDVRHNLFELPNTDAYEASEFDNASIMKYHFPAWMFQSMTNSHCYSDRRNYALSAQDVAAVQLAYPTLRRFEFGERQQLADSLTELQENVDEATRDVLRAKYDALVDNPTKQKVTVARTYLEHVAGGESDGTRRNMSFTVLREEQRQREIEVEENGVREVRTEEYTVMVPEEHLSAPTHEELDVVTTTVEEELPIALQPVLQQLAAANPGVTCDQLISLALQQLQQEPHVALRHYLENEVKWGFQIADDGSVECRFEMGEGIQVAARRSASDFGRFEGPLVASFKGDGRLITVEEDFTYVDARGKRWVAPKDSVVNGASIPRVFWSITGGPLSGRFREASVVHDVYCVSQTESWRDVHRMFYEACRASEVAKAKAKLLYLAVYHFGPRWRIASEESPARASAPQQLGPPTGAQLEAFEAFIEDEDPSLEAIEALDISVSP